MHLGRAAAAGGVTTIIARPDTTPPIDTPEALEFVRRLAFDPPAAAFDAAFASGMPSALETKGTVRLARGLASMT